MQRRSEYIFTTISKMFPNACCELEFKNVFQLAVSVVLSAQTTDKQVNLVTPTLFERYPTPEKLKNAEIESIETIIKSIGLYKTKSRNIINLSKDLVDIHQGVVPNDFDLLIKLPGIGRKTANVILSEGFGIPRIAVDTHVERVSKRLQFVALEADVLDVERKLMEEFDQHLWHKVHLSILFFGRYFCFAKNPSCQRCPFYKKECMKK